MKALVPALVVVLFSQPLGLAAQQPARPLISGAYGSVVQMIGANLIAAAEEMPGNKYGFKPTSARMTFGEVVVHLIEGNEILVSAVAGIPAPEHDSVSPTDPKDKLVAGLRKSFQFVDSAFAQMNDSRLADTLPFYQTRARAMFLSINHWADHYSQMAIYLRLNHLLPPTAKPHRK